MLRTQDGRTETVAGVETETLDEPVKVYNLEIEDSHTYYVSVDGVLVHNRCKLGENMKNDPDGIGDPGTDYDAHHMFPQKFRKIFEAVGIDVDDSDFGIWLDIHEHRSDAKAYNKKWEEFFSGFESMNDISIDDIIEFVNSLDKLW